MDVNSIINMVAALATAESNVDSDSDRQKELLVYVNIAYNTLYEECQSLAPSIFSTTAIVAITSGDGTLPVSWANIVSVRDTNNSSVPLEETTLLDIENIDPEEDNTGTPDRFYMNGINGIGTWPRNDTSLKVRHRPQATELEVGGDADTILIPPAYHLALVWETMKYAAFDERDKGFNVEVTVANNEYKIHKGRLKSFLTRMSKKELKVKQWH